MQEFHDFAAIQSRRSFLANSGLGVGAMALNYLLGEKASAAAAIQAAGPNYGSIVHPSLPGLPHFPATAKRIIYLHMNGAPSQLDLFDYKPNLKEQFGKDLPESIRKGQRITTMTSGQSKLPVAPSIFNFKQHGQSGMWISELLPHTASVADELTLIKTVQTDAINHDPACTFLMTGNELPGRASLGSWLSYGLGSVNENLPAFVVLTPSWSAKANAQALFTRMWSSGFLPTRFTGVPLRSGLDPVLFIKNPPGVDPEARRTMLDALGKLNQNSIERFGDPETQTRISQYEMAFRMQTSVPELTDFSGETKETLEMYGPEVNKPGTFAASALLARRLVERNVRVVKIMHRGWDQHTNLPADIRLQCKDIDQACAALLKDLRDRKMLDDTLVIWGGEFGRTVYSQGTLTETNYGRDHHPRNFCMWMAGGGVKRGTVYGETDDFSYSPVSNPVTLRDLNATILHAMGVDHQRLTFKAQGLDQKITGVFETHVLNKEILGEPKRA
jgi:Protein of unknown function (DUF1501)